MKHSTSKILSALLVAASASAIAAPAALAADLCPTPAVGVPTRPGAPKWKAFNAGDAVDAHVDDPRWNLASGKNFASGGAKAPLQTRMLWATENGQKVLYLSFLLNITPSATTSTTAGRDIYLGFKLPTPFSPHDIDPSVATTVKEYSYIFQFHLNNEVPVVSDPTINLIIPTRCDADGVCGETSATPANFWRVFADYDDAPGVACSDQTAGSITGEQFRPIAITDPAHPKVVETFAWPDTAVAYWKLDATPSFPSLKNQWVVQLRIPVVPATGTNNMRQGIVEGSKIWFEATADLGSVNRTSVANWPRPPELTTHVCQQRSFGKLLGLVHPDLSYATGKWSSLTLISDPSSAPSDCGGVALDQQDIGVIFNPAPGTDYSDAVNTHLDTTFSAVDSGGTSRSNEVVARIKSTTGADIPGNFIARFRIANWGAAPSSTDNGAFTDIPGAENGICAAGTAPSCTSASAPGDPTKRLPLHFSWQLTPTQICQYQVTPKPAGVTCTPGCSCSAMGAQCDHTSDPGVQSTSGGSTSACVSLRAEHQCIMVEVDAPASDVDFVNRSHWNNFEFHHTSVMAQTAMIDVRGLPKTPGQRNQDVYLVVMPRNMPASTGTPISGVDLIRQRTDQQIVALVQPYAQDLDKITPPQRDAIREKLQRHGLVVHYGGVGGLGYGGGGYGSGSGSGGLAERKPNEMEQRLMQIAPYMSDDDFRKAQALLDLALVPDGPGQAEVATHQAVDTLGPDAAADIVPTLDMYAFYRADPATVTTGALYLPMTSFSVFLFHNATPLTGLRWEIDGFKKVGANIYRQEIPVDHVRKIQVRAQSLEPSEATIPPGNPNWPCGCCGGPHCGTYAGISNTAPGLVAGAFLFRRRKRKSKKA